MKDRKRKAGKTKAGDGGMEKNRVRKAEKKAENDRLEVRTDLAMEERESFPGDGGEIPGVILTEKERNGGIRLTEVEILDERGAGKMRKPVGAYLTLEAPGLADGQGEKQAAKELADLIRKLLVRHQIGEEKRPRILVVGLGNPDATPDALGPMVMERLPMTRHLVLEYGAESGGGNESPMISGISPGVMAKTGMETAEIIRGIVKETRPDAVLAVDALAARSVHRLGVTIQLSDTGIHPGSGVGNHRNSLTEESLGIPVLALGAPTVVGAAAIVYDTVDALEEVLKASGSLEGYGEAIGAMGPEEQYELIREILEPRLGPMYVTPHDIDARVEILSGVISQAIQEALFSWGKPAVLK